MYETSALRRTHLRRHDNIIKGSACGTPRGLRITKEQRLLVLNAIQRLRQALNHSPCGSILDVAVEQLRDDWIDQCHHIRETWGDWQSFGVKHWYRAGGTAIAVEGIAEFAKGRQSTGWHPY